MKDLWVVTDYEGEQRGTKDQPWSIKPEEFDTFMHAIALYESPWTVHAPGHFLTRGAVEWGPLAGAAWRLPSGCAIDFHDGTLELDWQAIPDDYVQSIPWHLICSAEGWAIGKTGEEAWAAVPRDQAIRNVTMIANHSKLVDRFRAAGANLLISGAILQGHHAVLESIRLRDFGALGAEAFPLIILGCMAGPDRHALTTVDPSHEFDEDGTRSHISNVSFDDYVSANSTHQVSVALITGLMGSERVTDPWEEIGPWRQLYRRNPIIENVRGAVRDADATQNQCQLATIYQCHRGEIAGCYSLNFQAGVYGDFYSTVGLDVHHNQFLRALRPVAFLTSPTGPGVEQFSHDDVTIRSNMLNMIPTDEQWHGGVLLLRLRGPAQSSQHIRNVTIDDNDIVCEGKARSGNYAVHAEFVDGLTITPSNRLVGFPDPPWLIADCTRVSLPPAPASRRGCNPFR